MVREDNPELVLDELSHLFLQEGGMLVGGVVAASADAFVLLVIGPGCRVGLCRDSRVSPSAEEWNGGMIGFIQVGG